MYTDEELEAAIAQFLTNDVDTSKSEAGTRDIIAVKTQIYEIIAAAFMLRPTAIFSVCWMASNLLRAQVAAQLVDMQAILDAAPHVYKTSAKVESVTDLRNAEAALIGLTAAFGARTGGVAGPIGPAVARFNASIERFVRGELMKNTVSGGDVVQTPEELRAVIAARWAEAKPRHDEIVAAVEAIVGGRDAYSTARLPDSVVGSLLKRIQARLFEVTVEMGLSSAPQDARSTMLELAAMRALLAQASRFKVPELKKVPLLSDPATGLLVGATGTPAVVLGTRSGPFNYPRGAVLSYEVGGTPGSVILPGTSSAELRSQPMVAWAAPPLGSECAIGVDGASAPVVVSAAAWVDGDAAAAALDALVGVSVLWDGATSTLLFSSDSFSDGSSLQLLSDTEDRAAFGAWFAGTGATSAIGVPVSAAAVVATLAVDARLQASLVRQVEEPFDAVRSELVDEEDVLLCAIVEAGGLLADGSAVVRAPADLEALGVRAGMRLSTTAASRGILGVSGPTLQLDGTMAAGTYAYRVVPDFSAVEPDSRVTVAGSPDVYRVVSHDSEQLVLDRAFAMTERVRVTLVSELLQIACRATDAASDLSIVASAGAVALGLAAELYQPELDTFEAGVDLAARGVEVGDWLTLEHGVGAPTVHTIMTVSGTKMIVAPAVPYTSSALRYAVRSAAVQHYEDLRAGLEDVQVATGFWDSTALDQAVGRLARGGRYTGSLVTTLVDYVATLLELLGLLDSYQVPRDATVEQAVRLMVEHGFDRAADLFVGLRLTEFFALEADGVSYKTWVVRKAADVARLVVPVSKEARDPTSQWQTVAVQPTSYEPGS